MPEGEKRQLTDNEIAVVLGGLNESHGDDFHDPLFAYFCPTYGKDNS